MISYREYEALYIRLLSAVIREHSRHLAAGDPACEVCACIRDLVDARPGPSTDD